ncbi:MAG: glycoside hydrolase family 3 N-terminal domain-containing protein, partial [Acidobacteriota bacterium]
MPDRRSLRFFACSLAFTTALLCALAFGGPAEAEQTEAQKLVATGTTVDEKVEALLAEMTLAEKVGQLNQYSATFDVTGPITGANRDRRERLANGGVGSMLNVTGAEATRAAQEIAVEQSRLGIPMLFAYDVVHGYQTMFPIPLAESASWNLEAIERSARVAAIEASAAGLHWTFAPMVDISRDARWGRVMEGAGEDPYLGSVIAAARVRGFQGDDLNALDTVAACAKHFAGYGLAEAGRDYNTVDISEDTLRNVVFPPFQAALDAGVVTVMNAFNEIGGVPATSSVYLQREILKKEWAFDGFVVSDWGSIGELVPHGVAAGPRQAALLAITAGSDMDMESNAYAEHLAALVEAGEVKVELVDDAVRRILAVKIRLGLFDDPYRYSDPAREARLVYSDEHLAAASEVARESI